MSTIPPAGPRCAYPNGEDQGEHDHAMCEDVVAERAELAGRAGPDQPAEPSTSVKPPMPPAGWLAAHTMVGERAAAGAGWQEGYLAGRASAAETDPTDLAQAVAVAEALAAERDDARRERDLLQSRLDIIRQERRREFLAHQVLTLTAERDELTAEVGRLRTELDRADVALAAGWVLHRYDAQQCQTCGSRYTVPVEHPHPLTPVTVLVVRRGDDERRAAGLTANHTNEEK